jgi:hypothetical protein
MRAQGLGPGAVRQNHGIRNPELRLPQGRGPYRKTVADALATHQIVQTENSTVWVVTSVWVVTNFL